ncbi:MAG: HPr family phosphocarrier protein [Planctomycetaceae bacterium]|jgi:phosphocarrier protein|nr:HPr family phosphocarrier protein [Planctomycetaceae bacterium]
MTKTLTKDIVVQNRSGVHARPSTMIVQECNNFKSDIKLRRGGVVADCRSVLELLSLAACNGSELRLEAVGDDAEEAVSCIVALFEDRFNEDELSMW